MTDRADAPDRAALSQPEFIAMIAILIGTVAVSMDMMLPALPEIAAEITPDAPNRAGLVVSSFVFGMGLGTLFTGPLSDSYGRKPVILCGAVLYVVATLVAWRAAELEAMIAARFVQGLGAAASRTTAMALVRDLYGGRQMARVMSFILAVFVLAPAFAPLAGSWIIAVSGWREIFLALIVFATLGALWLGLRQPETLAPAHRRPFSASALFSAAQEVMAHPLVRRVIVVQGLCFGILFSAVVMIQPIFDQSFNRAAAFPVWFAIIALIASAGNFINAGLVTRLGMWVMVTIGLSVQAALAGFLLAGSLLGLLPEAVLFPLFIAWMVTIFMLAALTLSNLNAMAMEPLGHVAGMTASLVACLATIIGGAITVPITLIFDGTPLALMAGVFACAAAAVWLMWRLKRFVAG